MIYYITKKNEMQEKNKILCYKILYNFYKKKLPVKGANTYFYKYLFFVVIFNEL